MEQKSVYNQVVPKFKKVLGGYSPTEVDAFIKEMIYYYDILTDEKQKLLAEVKAYRRQKMYLSDLLIKSKQQVESAMAEARQKAQKLFLEAEQHRQRMEQDIISSLQQKNAQLVGKFFLLAQKYLDALDHEFTGEMKKAFKHFPLEQNLPQSQAAEKAKGTNSASSQEHGVVAVTEADSILAGRMLHQDIMDEKSNVMASKGTVVTPRLIEILIGKGLYGELIEALDPSPGNQREEGRIVAG